MGLLDNLKAKLAPAKDKVSDLAQQHEDKIQHGLDKAAQGVDSKTKGKYSDKIESGTGKAKDAMDRSRTRTTADGRHRRPRTAAADVLTGSTRHIDGRPRSTTLPAVRRVRPRAPLVRAGAYDQAATK